MQLILFSKGKSKIWFIVVSIVLGKFPTHVYKINEKHLFSTNIYQWSTSMIIRNGINILLTINKFLKFNFIKQI